MRVFEAGAELGGIWYWNRYPGARVDSHVPNYEFSIEELWRDWNWTERFPAWDELRRYFRYMDEKLGLSRDVDLNRRVTAAHFDIDADQWDVQCADGHRIRHAFSSPALACGEGVRAPPSRRRNLQRAVHPHRTLAPGRARSGGSSRRRDRNGGQRRPGHTGSRQGRLVPHRLSAHAEPGAADASAEARSVAARDEARYPEWFRLRALSGGGLFDVVADERSALDVSSEERRAVFESAWQKGGFHFWGGTFSDIGSNLEANRLAYDFWRERTRARIKDPVMAEKLAPMEPPHPLGTKRPSLEHGTMRSSIRLTSLVDVRADRSTRSANRRTRAGITTRHHRLATGSMPGPAARRSTFAGCRGAR